MKLGRIIRVERIAMRMSIEQLSEASGVHPNTLAGLENGKRLGGVGTLLKIARTLGLELTLHSNSATGTSHTVDD